MATKTEGGIQFPKAAYAYTPSDQPSTWKLRLWETPEEKVTAKQVGMAVAALGAGFRGNKVEIPDADKSAVRNKVLSAWKSVHPDAKPEDVPAVLSKGGHMADDNDVLKQLEEVEANQKVIEKRNTDLEAINKRFEAIVKMSPEERAVFDPMTAEEQDEFLKMSPEEKTAKAKAKAKASANDEGDDEEDDDEEVEKRVKAEVEKALAASNSEVEELKKRVSTAEEFAKKQADRADTVEFQKRADIELSHYTGTVEERGDVLKSIEKSNMTDDQKKNVMKVLKSGNEAHKQLGKMVGSNNYSDVEKSDGVLAEVSKRAKVLMDKDSKLTKAAAEAAVYTADPELYKRYLEEAN